MANYNVDALPPSLSKFVPASRGVDYRHTLPGRLKVGKLTKVLQKLDAYAASPERRFSPKDAAAAAKSIRRHVQDCSRKTKALQAQLEKSAEDNFLFRFHAVIGDYARVVCKALKESRPPRMLVGSWEDIVGALDKEEEKAARGIPSNKVHKQVEACVYALQKEHYPIDVDTALLAMRTYARRNYICHGEADQMIDKGDFKAAAKILLRQFLLFFWSWRTYEDNAIELPFLKPSQDLDKSPAREEPLADPPVGQVEPAAPARQQLQSQTPSRNPRGSTKRLASEQAEEPPSKRRKSGKTDKMAASTSKQQGGRRFKRPTGARRGKSS
ncbi:MAG: hypothetical protein LQ351_007887 [Letrouitia transgressa]|nr:MAG: hypothetical protein LQ351_007887 [Letrouitia transgressa]